MKKVLAYDPKKKKQVLVGYIDGKKFTRNVGPEHFMNWKQGYGIQEVAFAELLQNGITDIYFVEKHTKRTLHSKIQTWLDIPDRDIADYGHGKQRFLAAKEMKPIQKDLFKE